MILDIPVGPGRLFAPDARDQRYAVSDSFISTYAKKDRTAWKIGHVTDQGEESSCVGHAWSGLLRSAPIMERRGRVLPEPWTIYKGAQDNDEWEGNNYDGTSVRGGAKYLQQTGHIKSYHWIYGMDELIDVINNVGPAVIGIDWFDALMLWGIETTPSNVDQMVVFYRAMAIHAERNTRYKDAWKKFGWRGMLHDIYKKVTRIWQCFWTEGGTQNADLDDAIDVINYTAFFIRGVEEGNEHGTMPW